VKLKADGRYLPASSLIILGMSMPLLGQIARQWQPIANILPEPEFATLLGLSLAAAGLLWLAPHYHHHRSASKHRGQRDVPADPSGAARINSIGDAT
jgi:hypothetical protein